MHAPHGWFSVLYLGDDIADAFTCLCCGLLSADFWGECHRPPLHTVLPASRYLIKTRCPDSLSTSVLQAPARKHGELGNGSVM